MKNLKRALSLVLSTAMLLGMMVVGTGASYADVDAADNVEAIEIMQAVGVMKGDDKGNFNPDQKVTRNEMAVVMANLLGLKVADYEGTAAFTDVPAWAAPYVAACKANGIVAGTSATTFGGDQTVTAAQAGLMMMKALGYFQYQNDFEEDWQLATIKQASKIDLFDGMTVGATTELTRNEVAQLALNALESNMVDYSGSQGTNISLPDGTKVLTGYTIQYNPSVELGSDDYTTGDAVDADETYTQLVEELYGNDLTKRGATDAFGRSSNEWKYKTVALGKFAKVPTAVYTDKATKAALYDLIGKDAVADLLDGTKTAAKLNVWVDGDNITVNDKTNINYVFVKDSTASISVDGTNDATGNGTTTEVYVDNNTGAVNVVIINKYVVKASADYSSVRETVGVAMKSDNAPTLSSYALSSDDFDVAGVKKDDYLIITAAKNGATYDVKSVEPATILTGAVGSYKNASNVVIDGTTYKYGFKAETDASNGSGVAYAIGENTKVVTDGTYILYVDEATIAASNYVFIQDIAADGNFTNADLIAQAVFADGSKKVINIKSKTFAGRALNKDLATDEGWYTYSVNSDDIYTLTDITEGLWARSAGTTMTTAGSYTISGTSTKADGDTVFLVVDGDDDITVYTGIANVPTVVAGANSEMGVAFNAAGNRIKYVYVDADNGTIDGAKNTSDFIYVLKQDNTGVDADKNAVYYYSAIVNGEDKDIVSNIALSVNTLYTDVKYDGEYVDFANVVAAHDDYTQIDTALSGAVTYTAGNLTLGGATYVLDADCVINLIARDGHIKADAAADHELVLNINADTLASMLNGYTATGSYWAQIDTDTNAVVALYINLTATA